MKQISAKSLTYFIIALTMVGIVWNLIDHEQPIQDSQYGILGIWALGYVTSYLRLPRLSMYVIYFVLFMVIERQIGGYRDWTSWIIFAVVAVFMTWVTDLIRTTYASRYDKPKKKDHKNETLNK
ncbi:hypothetical protein [Lentilactobacillus kefiri]|uniref:hypothetical protein n=1 Tax=Lentilactobacillus kefiri TaxID=33962 RepID=UPI002074289B|nr:hypothetical protein [Lentilactobacillus kefiri]